MKIRLTIAFILGVLTLAFIFNKSETGTSGTNAVLTADIKASLPPGNGGLDKFYVGSAQSEDDYHSYPDNNNTHYTQLDSLGFNLWHEYLGGRYDNGTQRWEPAGYFTGSQPYDTLMADANNYYTQLNTNISSIYAHNNRRLLLTRPKIEYLCYGQRSDYRCVDINHLDDSCLWFYSFQSPNHIGNDEQDNIYDGGKWVRHCTGNPSNPESVRGMVVSRLKANTEQCKSNTLTTASGQWQCDSQWDWFIKPKIRIDSNFAHNNGNAKVCEVKVIAQNGSTVLKDDTIKAANFINPVTGNYGGQYLEEFYLLTDSLKLHGDWGNNFMWGARGNQTSETGYNKADIQVYWYGNCDMWIDYVRVDNEVADKIFKNYYDDPTHPENRWLYDEVSLIGNANSSHPILKYYIELSEFNNLPCMAYVNAKIKQYSHGQIDLAENLTPDNITFHVPYSDIPTIWNVDFLYHEYIQKVGFTALFSECYPLNACHIPDGSSQTFSDIPNTLPNTTGQYVLGKPVSPQVYEDWFQDMLTHSPSIWEGGQTLNCDNSTGQPYNDISEFTGQFRSILQVCNGLSKMADIPIIFMPQAHAWYNGWETHREPTNEELDMMTNVIVSYGAKSLLFFDFSSFTSPATNGPMRDYTFSTGDFGTGLADRNPDNINNFILRKSNYYNQDHDHGCLYKWEVIKNITDRMCNKWGQYLMSFDNTQTNSYIYNNSTERAAFLGSYFNEVDTYAPDISGAPSSTADPQNSTYLQAATFVNSNDAYSKYFMLVNRRCSPYTSSDNGGRRDIKIKFDANPSELSAFKNWKIINVEDSSVVTTFDKQVSSFIDLGWYLPGEGRLYKIVPVMVQGGTLVVNESFGSVNFTCNGNVFNAGKDITITGNSSIISFADTASIYMNSGTFLSSSSPSMAPVKNTFQSTGSGHHWPGLTFISSNVKMYNSKFQDADSTAAHTCITCFDCPLIDVRYNTFISSDTTNGGISAVYTSSTSSFSPPNVYIDYNTFTMNDSRYNAVQVQGFGGLTTGVYAENNTMTSNGSATGIFISTITGGVIKNNSITGFSNGINMLFSTADIYGNTITNTGSTSKGILASSHSSMNMTQAGTDWTGGMNRITNTYGNSHNIDVTYSVFNMNGGNNTLDVSSSGTPYHLYGSFWSGSYNTRQRYNCFKLSGTAITSPTQPDNSVTDSSGTGITFSFTPYTCSSTPPSGTDIVDIGNGLYDTIPSGSSGMGGGERNSINNYLPVPQAGELTITNSKANTKDILPLPKGELEGVYGKTTPPSGHPSLLRRGAVETYRNTSIQSIVDISDSINIQMRHKSYNTVKTLCHELIDNYPDSMESIASLQTLYLAVSLTDTTTAGKTALKTYYENLILNHGYDPAIVDISNYLIQKCKVLLRQYSSAMSGFQQIIDNNPYNYEGLLARWDYMAASLLMNGGSGGIVGDNTNNGELVNPLLGGVSGTDGVGDNPDELNSLYTLYGLGDDKNPFTKEQKKSIIHSIITATKTKRETEEAKVNELKVKSDLGDANAKAELNKKMALKNTNKTEKPKNIYDHLKIVNHDIQKVFGVNEHTVSKGENLIPLVFMLHQNYPNPFNPSATIKYDLPKDVKVQIKIYDILGREVKTLVNEFKKAGFYQAVFDGTNLASGVYFYKIEAGDFIDSKKMVLIK